MNNDIFNYLNSPSAISMRDISTKKVSESIVRTYNQMNLKYNFSNELAIQKSVARMSTMFNKNIVNNYLFMKNYSKYFQEFSNAWEESNTLTKLINKTGILDRYVSPKQLKTQVMLSTPEFADEFQDEVKTAFKLSVEALQASPSDRETINNATQEHVSKQVFKNVHDHIVNLPPTKQFVLKATGAWGIEQGLDLICWLFQNGTPIAIHMATHLITFLSSITLPM